jgi:hypothetical protein
MTVKPKPIKQGRVSTVVDKFPQMVKYVREEGWKELGHAVPTVEGMACFVGCSRQNVYLWGNDYPEVKELMDELITIQGFALVNGGLNKTFDSAVTRMLLGKHGYAEKSEVDHSSKDGTMTPAPVVSVTPAMAAEILKKLNDEI